jgi:hypothetical protein
LAPSQLGAWDVAVVRGLVVIPGAGLLLALGEQLAHGSEIAAPTW